MEAETARDADPVVYLEPIDLVYRAV